MGYPGIASLRALLGTWLLSWGVCTSWVCGTWNDAFQAAEKEGIPGTATFRLKMASIIASVAQQLWDANTAEGRGIPS